jgi:hypothetical protein
MRTILVTGIILLSILMLFSLWVRFEPFPKRDTLAVRQIQKQLSEFKEIEDVPQIVQDLNQKNSLVRSFVCEKISVKTWERGLRIRLSADVHYEKDDRFRLIISSAFGSEMDLGTNDEIFWYWSRRDREPGVYWAAYENYHKTRLKTPFNPVFMRDTLGFNEVDTDARVGETDEYMMLVYDRYNALGQPVLYTIIVDKENTLIDGVFVTDMDGVPLATADIQRYPDGLPKRILYTWHEENRMLSMEFNQPQINLSLSSTYWVPPNKKPKINMAEE